MHIDQMLYNHLRLFTIHTLLIYYTQSLILLPSALILLTLLRVG